jgi:sugar lactone lactonase YvrE
MPSIQEFSHQPLAEGGLLFGESPRYHNGLLYISDMLGCKIYTVDPKSGDKNVLLKVDQQPNGMFFHPDGSLIYSSMFDAKLYRLKDGTSALFSDLSSIMTGYCGDMFIDSKGRVYLDDVGARVLHGQEPAPGRLIMVDTDGAAKSVAEDLLFPNALVISKDGKSLFVAETFGPGLSKYDVGPGGELSNKTIFWSPTSLPDYTDKDGAGLMVKIDGGCIDDDDNIWLSMLGYEQFIRIDKNGHINARIKVKGHATACCLGGPDGKTLFLVVNQVPEGEVIFSAMREKRTTCTIATATVDVGIQKI